MAKAEIRTHVGLQVPDPDYWELLSHSLNQAKALLWKRLQHGAYADDEEAKATMDAYWALRKVARLMEEKIRQFPLPETKGEPLTAPAHKDPLVMRKPLPQEADR